MADAQISFADAEMLALVSICASIGATARCASLQGNSMTAWCGCAVSGT
jgi:hypothetical protein